MLCEREEVKMEILNNLEEELDHALHHSLDKVKLVFDKIYKKYSNLVYYVIMKSITCKEDCEELTNDVFVNFFNRINSFDANRSIKYYLIQSAKNKIVDYQRGKKDNTVTYNDDIYIEDDKSYDDFIYRNLIDEWKLIVSEFELQIIVYHVIYGYTFSELSEMYGSNVNTIKSTYKRAIAKIRKYYDSKEKIN